jgi:xylan 1,4-beta-xylosidase
VNLRPYKMLGAAMLACALLGSAQAQTWTADNGNGTFTNPLFYDEFSDPDLIRVGDDFYLTGTTMHAMPGLPILHSRDLVNWRFLGYASDKLDLGPAFRLEGGKNIYGQGIWAPSFRYHKGTFYIFTNVNGQKTQIYTATDPKGPWTHKAMKQSLHDLSVLFDDDGKVYAIYGYREIKMVQLSEDLTDVVPGSERTIIPAGSKMGEGVHFYKLGGKYYILSAWYDGRMRMPAARADRPEGPYEVNEAISIDEDFGLAEGHRLSGKAPPFAITPPNPAPNGRMSLHQGGIVQAGDGAWWGFSMMDYNSVGRLLSLSPITWKDGWPYFGLPGNLGRTPRTWVKPYAKTAVKPAPVYERSDDFAAATLKPVWQWNHVPVDSAWSLTERPGHLRLHALPAASFWDAKNSLTQRAIGPRSSPTVLLDAAGMKAGDTAGLALLNRPYAWLGVERTADGLAVAQFDQQTGQTARKAISAQRVWLRADCDFMTEKARFSYSTDGTTFTPLGDEFTMVFQLTTFQGVRYALFNYSGAGAAGGYADFDEVKIHEPFPHGLMKPIPYGRNVTLKAHGAAQGLRRSGATLTRGAAQAFRVRNMGLGRVALGLGSAHVTVAADGGVTLAGGKPGTAQSFQWSETPTGELVLMSLVNHRFLRIDPATGAVSADSPGPQSDGRDGVRFDWSASR